MAVEAARAALRSAPAARPATLYFATAAPLLAAPIASASVTAEFLDRWRLPGEPASRQWEERFGEHAYVPLGAAAVADGLKQAGLTAAAVTRWVVTGPHGRASRRVAA